MKEKSKIIINTKCLDFVEGTIEKINNNGIIIKIDNVLDRIELTEKEDEPFKKDNYVLAKDEIHGCWRLAVFISYINDDYDHNYNYRVYYIDEYGNKETQTSMVEDCKSLEDFNNKRLI